MDTKLTVLFLNTKCSIFDASTNCSSSLKPNAVFSQVNGTLDFLPLKRS